MIMPLPPCPGKNDVVRRYEVAAVQTNLIYNRYGDHDPDGLIFVPLKDVDGVLSGRAGAIFGGRTVNTAHVFCSHSLT